jgi:hypothetical protein
VPSDFGISALVADAYADFTHGLDVLSDGGQRDARDRAVRRRPEDADVRSINIPGWDDVVHAIPRPRATRDEKDAHYAAKRAGQASPLNPDLQFEIERRGRQARAIQQSASPGYAQAAGQVLTALDNVQDLVTTVATVGRLTINPAIRVLDAIGPQPTATAISNQFARTELARLVARRAAGEAITAGVQAEALFVARRAGVAAFQTGAYKLGTFALGRAVPVLGWVLLAADLMKLVTQIGMLAFPAYALACAGPRAGLAAGLPALLMGPTLCKPIGAWSKINPFGRKSKLARSRLARSWRPTVPNLIEVAQTTDSLFGVGISLGALTGLVSDTAFGIEQQNRGKDVRINATGAADSMHRIFSGQLARESGAALHDLRRAAGVLGYGPTLHAVQDVFTVEEHIDSLIATTCAMSILQPYLMAPEMDEAVNLALELEWAPPVYLEDTVRADMEAEGVQWPAERRWPMPGAPRTIKGADLLTYGAGAVPAALADLLRPIRDDVASTFIGAVVNQITERSAVWMTGSDDAIAYQDNPVYEIMTSLALSNRWPNVGDGEAKVSRFFQLAENEMALKGSRSLSAAQLDAAAKRAGLFLIRGLPVDAPYPPGLGT